MSRNQSDSMWSAYLDGELSAGESAAFDADLSQADRDRLAGEVQLEAAIAEQLGAEERCPEALWDSIVSGVEIAPSRQIRLPRRWVRPWALAAMAAAFVLVAGLLTVLMPHPTPEFLARADSIQSLQAEASVTGFPATREFLRTHQVNLTLKPLSQIDTGPHTTRLIGATEEHYRGESVVELLYNCCGFPVKVVVTPKDSAAARRLADGMNKGDVEASRVMGDYLVAVVGHDHPSAYLLDTLQQG